MVTTTQEDAEIRRLLGEGFSPYDIATEILDREFAAGELAADEVELAFEQTLARAERIAAE